uniref:Putative secreted protein n=1 Tax=Anopheles marajoara TaxID=58244 RepID=A0A2M4CBW0_9DIPT
MASSLFVVVVVVCSAPLPFLSSASTKHACRGACVTRTSRTTCDSRTAPLPGTASVDVCGPRNVRYGYSIWSGQRLDEVI